MRTAYRGLRRSSGYLARMYHQPNTSPNIAIISLRNSDVIIAINRDPKAPIFEVANLGVVGDLFKILPLLTEALSENE